MGRELLQRISCILLVALVLNMSFFPAAFAGELPSTGTASLAPDPITGLETPPVNPLGTGAPTLVNEPPREASFTCSSPDSNPAKNILLPEEVQKLKQKTEIENPGFEIDNINSGRGQNDDRDELENNIVIQKADDGSAMANALPNSKMDTGEISQWFNKYFDGPFAFGLSLDDTIRIGQCRNLSGLEARELNCPLTGKELSFRNSGEGITSNFKNVWADVKDMVFGEETGQYSKEEHENLQTQIVAETDVNSLQAKFFSREVEFIPNSVKTEDFTANMATTGDSSKSLISVYSMFDKYFNSWFSSEMVVSTFGPTLFGQAKKYAGWAMRRGFPAPGADGKFMSWFRRSYLKPQDVLGEARLKRMVIRNDKYGFGKAWTKGIENADWDSGYAFAKGGSMRKALNEWTEAGGYLDEMTDPVMRGEFFKQISDLRGYAHANKAVYSNSQSLYDDAIRQFGGGSPEARAALIDHAKTSAKLQLLADGSHLKLDAPELWLHEDLTGLYNMAVKQKGIEQFVPLSGDSKHIATIQKGFINDSWADPSFLYNTTPEGFMQFYKLSPTGEFIDNVAVDDLRKGFGRYVDKMAQTERGDFIKIDGSTIDFIAKESPTGKVKIYTTNWVPADPETPEMFAKRLTHGRAQRISSTMPDNLDRLYNTLVERNFSGQNRRYLNILDKAFAQEQEILKSYFSIKGGAKWTIMPFLYWQGKRGFGFEGISAFQLPNEWKEVEVYTGDEQIFDEAFIDIFAQHGSDEGEIFSQVLNALPWKMVLDYVNEEFNSPVKEGYESWTNPLSGWRRSVENVAYFTSTRNDCATCGVVLIPKVLSQDALADLKKEGRGQAVISFGAQQDMKSYFVEDILNEKTKKEGTTLIAFGHHTNIKGEAIGGDAVTEPIDLIKAKKEEIRCSDAVKEIGMGFLGDNPQRAAAILAFGESLGYAIFLWSGILGTVIQQTLLVPKLQDCVDDVEGYYLHMYAAYDPEAKGTVAESKKPEDVVKNTLDGILGKKPVKADDKKDDDKKTPVDVKGKGYTPEIRDETVERQLYNRDIGTVGAEEKKSILESAKEKLMSTVEKVGNDAKAKDILQMEVETMGETKGIMFFEKMFFFWFKGNTQQAVYDDYSRSVLEDTEKGVGVIVDKAKGTIAVKKKGKPAEDVITSTDHVRLSGPDGRVPAEVIPQRIGSIILPEGPGVPLFEMDYKSNFKVLDSSVLDCIRQNVVEQTGVPLTTSNISDAFGALKTIVTTTYPSITGSEKDKSITANGAPREIVYGDNAHVLVLSDMTTTLLNGREIPAGQFRSAQFKNGVILFKPASGGMPAELLIWLRYHQKSILRNDDVSGLRATVADPVINPLTGCPEPAINLEALPNLAAGSDSAITERVAAFNQSIDKMGPFQTFDTEKHRFIFYSEKTSASCDPSSPGCCQDRVRIINKETGEVIDEPLVGGIVQTPTGIKFTTKDADGNEKEHTLDFSAENGVPKISYNNGAPETLLTARGPNGAFWYDPEEGLWRPYNAQLLPMLENFKTQGFDTRHREDSSSSTMPGANTMNIDFGGAADTPFNLPGLPTQPMAMLLFILSLMAVIGFARIKINKKFGA